MALVEPTEKNELRTIAERFIPHPDNGLVAVEAPGDSPGFWVGASSAVEVDGTIYLAYRSRQPIELGRGQGVVIAQSSDGIKFTEICTISKESMDAESLERPTLIHTPEGAWRLYLSCATTGTKHWRVELLEADSPANFSAESRRTILPGDEQWGVKDTVIQRHNGLWHLWATMHPLDIKDAEDRMRTDYATSQDGIAWEWQGTALAPEPGSTWDARGTRVTAVHFAPEGIVAFYDGRATAAENYDERTGIAMGTTPGQFISVTMQELNRPMVKRYAILISSLSPTVSTDSTTRLLSRTARTSCVQNYGRGSGTSSMMNMYSITY
jgi:sucrose-6-phosphate hydrolase SacC (GH32 family)